MKKPIRLQAMKGNITQVSASLFRCRISSTQRGTSINNRFKLNQYNVVEISKGKKFRLRATCTIQTKSCPNECRSSEDGTKCSRIQKVSG